MSEYLLKQRLEEMSLKLYKAKVISRNLTTKDDRKSKRDYFKICKIIDQLESEIICLKEKTGGYTLVS